MAPPLALSFCKLHLSLSCAQLTPGMRVIIEGEPKGRVLSTELAFGVEVVIARGLLLGPLLEWSAAIDVFATIATTAMQLLDRVISLITTHT